MFDLNSSRLARRSFLGASVGAMAAGFAAQALPALAQTPTDVSSNFFAGFRRHTIQTSGTTINVLVGGNGSPILLLHGYPQTHVEWRKIAPQLSANYTVVIPDLRGYGDSGKPEDGDNHINYSKRVMALDQVEVMASQRRVTYPTTPLTLIGRCALQ
jgi:haloacetate dehalogenase